ncbi:MAG: SDR family NAD(P)-dependent oxidoreductase [Planctomycetota bacterium]|jgi:NAD(P)-dependent dehydrogenase (short-subunit alcohol dehydrogenase family)
MAKLEGRTAVVTGGTSGMGRGIAERFAAEGAAVVIGGRNAERGEEVVAAITNEGGRACFCAGDIGTVEANQALVDSALSAYGSVDILVPNAGILGIGSVFDAPLSVWHDTLNINLNAAYYLIHAAVGHMKERGGAIVVNGSIAALKGFPNHPAYCASKGALLALVRQLAIDLAPTIRINILTTGQVDTPLLHASAAAFADPQTVIDECAQKVPLGRLGTPADIASAALFLASDESSWMTGSSLIIDGGGMTGA